MRRAARLIDEIVFHKPVDRMVRFYPTDLLDIGLGDRLVEYDLVYEAGRLDAPGRPALFATTEEFLRRFGVGSTEQLPEMNVEQREEIRSEVEEELNLRIDEEGHLLDDDEDPEEDADENENEKEIENNEAYGEDSIS